MSEESQEAYTEEHKRRPKKNKPTEGQFGLPESPYKTLITIIRALYHVASYEPATLDEIATVTSLGRTRISQNNKFLISMGIVSKTGRRFILSEKGSTLGLALDYEDPDDIAIAWRDLVSESDFLQMILSSVDIKGGMKEEELSAHISKSGGFPHKRKYLAGASTIVDVLLASRLLARMDDALLNVTPEYSQLRLGVKESRKIVTEKIGVVDGVTASAPARNEKQQARFIINLNVSLTAETTDAEVEEIAEKIRKLAGLVSRE